MHAQLSCMQSRNNIYRCNNKKYQNQFRLQSYYLLMISICVVHVQILKNQLFLGGRRKNFCKMSSTPQLDQY